MKLETVFFDAYKSLLNAELSLSQPCMGMVGINESGKSNVLHALKALSEDNPLAASDVPKMGDKPDPRLRFVFSLSNEDKEALRLIATERGISSRLIGDILEQSDISVTYHVSFDRANDKEARSFTIDGARLPANAYTRRTNSGTAGVQIQLDDGELVPLEGILLLSGEELESNRQLHEASSELADLRQQEEQLQDAINEVAQFNENNDATEEASGNSNGADDDESQGDTAPRGPGAATVHNSRTLEKKRRQLQQLQNRIAALEKKVGDFDPFAHAESLRRDIRRFERGVTKYRDTLATLSPKIKALEGRDNLNDDQKKQLASLESEVGDAEDGIEQNTRALHVAQEQLDSLEEPLKDKFTDNSEEFASQLGNLAHEALRGRLPKVVFWTYSDDYILKGETEFSDLKRAKTIDGIPRPLLNLFRIGLRIDSHRSLMKVIKEIQTDSSERSRHQDTLNDEVNLYLKSVWPDYDQEIRITLEKERMRVQFFDPNRRRASYYEMQERSQGCQTFISFLLTVGAEAKQGVIKDSLLLLDEPETHLHPSGVRYMLHELIKAARNGNVVVFATHSVFMIDKERYDRHVIICKQKEVTEIQPSTRARVGYFMQEEVLYGAIDIDLSDSVSAGKHFNFVFEGDGDARLFEAFYRHGTPKASRPFPIDKTSFYHGGKCGDMMKYFKQRPIQLGTKWVVVLDRDQPASTLRSFIESRYKAYIGQDIFVYQYSEESDSDLNVELEDLLPSSIIQTAVSDAATACDVTPDLDLITSGELFAAYFPKLLSAETDRARRELFKCAVKECLNRQITKAADEFKNSTKLKEFAPKYASWVADVLADLERSTSPAEKNAPPAQND